LEVTLEDGVIRVVAPMDGTPAEEAGIRSGDLIIRLDGITVKGQALDQAVERMRGEPGSAITLTILREGVETPFDVTVKRAIIQLQSVRGELLEARFAYTRISQFQSGTGASLRRQLERLEEQADGPLSGLVLDLRNNPGGVLNGAVEVSDLFLSEGVIVSTRGRAADSAFTFNATGRDVLNGAPLVVLVNRGSASASEIVAGALQDHQRGLILGTKTFGKGSVQTILPMKNGAALKLTTARYYTPNNRSIQATGIQPDIVSRQLELATSPGPTHGGIRESDLAGHLENENDASNETVDETAPAELLQDRDFEVGEALNLLKGMVIARRQVDQ
jgi:carboxyl-terminal processing protease